MKIALTYNVKPGLLLTVPASSSFPSLQRTSISDQLEEQYEASPEVNELYAEWDAPETIEAICSALELRGDVSKIEADDDAIFNLREVGPDIVFNIAEGLYGTCRESYIPAICEQLQLPYTGSDGVTLALCLEKSRAKEILSYYKIPTAPFQVIDSLNMLEQHQFDFSRTKKFVKPVHEGSGIGIFNSSIVSSPDELEREVRRVFEEYKQPVLVEDFLEGREFTVAMLGNGNRLRVLPIIEMTFEGLPAEANPIYGYESKWIYDLPDKPVEECYRCPAPISGQLQSRVEQICIDAFNVLGCRDWCRIDVRCDREGNPHIIELNPLPGVIPDPNAHSSFPMAARAAGIQYNDIIHLVLDAALARYQIIR